jgi:hypothetical protein
MPRPLYPRYPLDRRLESVWMTWRRENSWSFFFTDSTALGPSPLSFIFMIILQTVGRLGRVISSSQGLYLNTGQHKHRTNIRALRGIRTYDPSFRAREGSTFLRPLGYRDRNSWPYRWLITVIIMNINCRMDIRVFRSAYDSRSSPTNTPLIALSRALARGLFICSSCIVSLLRKREPLWSRPNAEAITSVSNRSLSAPAPRRWHMHHHHHHHQFESCFGGSRQSYVYIITIWINYCIVEVCNMASPLDVV